MKKFLLFSLALLFFGLKSFSQCTCTAPVFVASSQTVGTTTGINIPKPVGVQPGHLMIAAIHVGWCNSGSAIVPLPGWTLISNTSNTGSGCGASNTTIQLATFYKIAGNSEPLNYSFIANSNQWYVGGIVAYSGVNPANPIHASSNNGAQDLCASIVAPGVTNTVSCSRLVGVFFCSVNNSLNNIIPQASMTERVDIGTTGNHPWGNENLEIADEVVSSAGATGNRTAGLSGCSSNGWVTGAQLIAINPSSAGGNPTITVNSGSICPGSSFTMSPSGASSYTFQGGSAVVNPTASTTYTVIGSTGSCTSNIVTASVNVAAAPSLTTSTSNSLICVGQSSSLTANGANTYTWNTSATTSVIVVTPTVTTSYTVTGTAPNGCTNTAVISQSVSTCAALAELGNQDFEFGVYPNPNSGHFTLELSVDVKLEIMNALGQIILSEKKLSGQHLIDISKYQNGVYMLKLSKGDKSSLYRIVKQ